MSQDIKRVRQLKTPLFVHGAVGFSGFFADPAIYVLDYHGLCDPLLSPLSMVVENPEYKNFYEKNTRQNMHEPVANRAFSAQYSAGVYVVGDFGRK